MNNHANSALSQAKEVAAAWPGQGRARLVYGTLLDAAQGLAGLAGEGGDPNNESMEFLARPGVSLSLRILNPSLKRPLVAMLDVIDDDPENRWLSVCFYADLITDPQELGDIIPGGLQGGDGYCFDVEGDDGAPGEYLAERLREAWAKAAGS